MKIKTLLALSFLALVVFNSCEHDTEDLSVDYPNLRAFFAGNCLPVQYHSLDASVGGTIIGNNGVEIAIPANILVDTNNQPIAGIVDIELVEALNFDDIVFSRRSNFINQRPVKTNGQFMLTIKKNGQYLNIAPGQYYTVNIPRKDPSIVENRFCVQQYTEFYHPESSYEVCKEKPDTNSWYSRINYNLDYDGTFYNYAPTYPPYVDTVYANPSNNLYYTMKVSQTGWIACNSYEYYYTSKNYTAGLQSYRTFNIGLNASYTMQLPREYNFSNNSYNTMLYLYADNQFISPINIRNDNQFPAAFTYVSNYYTPPFRVIALGLDSITHTMYYGETTISSIPTNGNININVQLNPTGQNQIIQNLDNLQ